MYLQLMQCCELFLSNFESCILLTTKLLLNSQNIKRDQNEARAPRTNPLLQAARGLFAFISPRYFQGCIRWQATYT